MPEENKISPKELYEKSKQKRPKNNSAQSSNTQNLKLWGQRIFGIVFFITVIIGVGWFGYTKLGVGHFDPTTTCITAETYHVHPHLTIKINGEDQNIPANIGSIPCHLPLHTHDNDGVIHLENAFPFDATLGQFFTIWKKPFNSQQIMDYKINDTHELILTVDGQPSGEFENFILKDKQEIVIEYREKNVQANPAE